MKKARQKKMKRKSTKKVNRGGKEEEETEIDAFIKEVKITESIATTK